MIHRFESYLNVLCRSNYTCIWRINRESMTFFQINRESMTFFRVNRESMTFFRDHLFWFFRERSIISREKRDIFRNDECVWEMWNIFDNDKFFIWSHFKSDHQVCKCSVFQIDLKIDRRLCLRIDLKINHIFSCMIFLINEETLRFIIICVLFNQHIVKWCFWNFQNLNDVFYSNDQQMMQIKNDWIIKTLNIKNHISSLDYLHATRDSYLINVDRVISY